MNSKFIDRFNFLTAKAVTQNNVRNAKRIKRTGPIGRGDAFALNIPHQGDVMWVVLHADPDLQHVWCVAPADPYELLIGPYDYEIPSDAPHGPMGVRLNHHLWVHADLLPIQNREAYVEDIHVKAMWSKLCKMAHGKNTIDPLSEVIEATDEYQEIEEIVGKAEAALEAAFNGFGQSQE